MHEACRVLRLVRKSLIFFGQWTFRLDSGTAGAGADVRFVDSPAGALEPGAQPGERNEMRALIALCVAALLSGCIPIGFRGGTMPLQGATGGAIQVAADVSATDRRLAGAERDPHLGGPQGRCSG